MLNGIVIKGIYSENSRSIALPLWFKQLAIHKDDIYRSLNLYKAGISYDRIMSSKNNFAPFREIYVKFLISDIAPLLGSVEWKDTKAGRLLSDDICLLFFCDWTNS